MIITIITIGSRGDVQPMVALGQGLLRAGFSVRIATHANFQPFIESYGLQFYRIGEKDVQQVLQEPEGKELLQQKNSFKALTGLRDLLATNIVEIMQDMTSALEDADLAIIGGLAVFYGGIDVCLQEEVPMAMYSLLPIIENTQVQSTMFPIFPEKMIGKRIYNYITHLLLTQGFWQVMRPVINHGRAEVWGLEKAPFFGYQRQEKKEKRSLLLGYSPTVIPPCLYWFWKYDQ